MISFHAIIAHNIVIHPIVSIGVVVVRHRRKWFVCCIASNGTNMQYFVFHSLYLYFGLIVLFIKKLKLPVFELIQKDRWDAIRWWWDDERYYRIIVLWMIQTIMEEYDRDTGKNIQRRKIERSRNSIGACVCWKMTKYFMDILFI